MIKNMHVCNQKIKNLGQMGGVMYQLPQLWGELQDEVWFVIIEITKKDKSDIFVFHFKQVVIGCYMIIE